MSGFIDHKYNNPQVFATREPRTIVCKLCGKEFKTRCRSRKFCEGECERIADRQRRDTANEILKAKRRAETVKRRAEREAAKSKIKGKK